MKNKDKIKNEIYNRLLRSIICNIYEDAKIIKNDLIEEGLKKSEIKEVMDESMGLVESAVEGCVGLMGEGIDD